MLFAYFLNILLVFWNVGFLAYNLSVGHTNFPMVIITALHVGAIVLHVGLICKLLEIS
jgi:hypothetical protein